MSARAGSSGVAVLSAGLVVALLLSGACGAPTAPSGGERGTGGGTGRTLLVGLIPEQNLFKQMERYEPIAAYVSRKAGVRIRLTVLSRYGNIVDNFAAAGMDGAFFGSFTYALAHERLGVEALARPVGLDGRSTYYGMIFVRKDSGIRSIAEMKGKRFAFVDKATTAGYLLPMEFFRKNGKDYRTYLGESYFAGTHENAIHDVLDRKADIGAAKNTVFDRLAASEERIGTELAILERSPEVPENALAVRKNLDASLRKRLREALVGMHLDPEAQAILKTFGAQRFVETRNEDYRPVYEYAREAGLDLSTYDYMNDR